MPEQPKQFDFSKEKDQEKFKRLRDDLKEEVIVDAKEKSLRMLNKIETGEAKNYDEAEKKIEGGRKLRTEDIEKIVKANFTSCSWFSKGGSRYYYEIAERIVEGEKRLAADDRENGDEAAEIMKDYFSKYAEQKLDEKGLLESFVHADLNWDNFKDILYVDVRTHEGNEEIVCNGIGFNPIVPLIEKRNPEFKSLVEQVINNSFFEHYTSGWMGHDSSDSKFYKNLTDIEKGSFCKNNGFYVAPTFYSWGGSGDESSKGKTVLYFNDFLMKIMTPSPEVVSKYIFSIDEHPEAEFGRGSYLNKNKKFVIVAERLETGYSKSSLRNATGEEGDVEFILALLAGKNHDLTFYSDVLGLMLELPSDSISEIITQDEWGKDRKWGVDLKGKDPILLKLLSSNECGVEGTKLIIDPLNKGSKCVTWPIMRIIPEILSGVIEYGKNNEVLRVAVPENGKFKVYDKDSFSKKEIV